MDFRGRLKNIAPNTEKHDLENVKQCIGGLKTTAALGSRIFFIKDYKYMDESSQAPPLFIKNTHPSPFPTGLLAPVRCEGA